ncbi:plasmid mobilization protein [Mucilaginibacter sp.]
MARPPKPTEDKLTIRLSFRLTPAELEQLNQLAEACGIAPSVLVRQKLFTGRFPQPKAARLDRDAYLELKKIGVNLNQLTKKVNAGLMPIALLPVLDELNRKESIIIEKLTHDRQSENR